MANGRNRANVMVGAPDVSVSGGVWIGKEITDPELFPTGAAELGDTVATAAGLVTGGYITSDGVSESEDRSTEKVLDWNLDVIDIVETDYSMQLTTTFAEAANADVLRFIYGDDNVEVIPGDAETSEVYVKKGARQPGNVAFMFDTKGKGAMKGRGFAASCQVASVGEITYTKGGLIQYNVTIDVLNDTTGTYLHSWMTRESAADTPAV